MSPEDIFASQMWPWPEPALKRDSMGRVLFVNAAFLQMYGGQIDDWRGNVVTGWPAPQPPGMPYRFETRLPSNDGEQVYDWMEFTLADGNAFAMARNVTYLFQSPEPDPGAVQDTPPAEAALPVANTAAIADASHVAQDTTQPAFAEQQVQDPVVQAPVAQAPVIESPIADVPVVDVSAADNPAMAESISADINTINADPVFDSASYDDLTTSTPEAVTETPQAPAAPQAESPQDDRAYERRALPLENENAVLGNNWRDAVIAKAVGSDVSQEEDNQTHEAADSTKPADAGDNGPIRILLAEDNAINALLTRTLLEAEGHTVETVEDGVLAVEAMKSSKYDLIFMDMRMPNMDGLEATRKIRAMPNVSKGLPIIALTANAFDDDRNACFDSGMNDFMTKPVSAEELSEMVRTWTKNKAERDAAAA